ncbi:hypothetical protein ACWGOQ_0008495 [Aquimarina sp. M1]
MAVSVYGVQQTDIRLPVIVQSYVNDFLCMPIILNMCQMMIRKLKSDPDILLSLPLLLFVTTGYAFYFEWYLPQHLDRYTSDWIDVLLYFWGMIFFYWIERVTYGPPNEP